MKAETIGRVLESLVETKDCRWNKENSRADTQRKRGVMSAPKTQQTKRNGEQNATLLRQATKKSLLIVKHKGAVRAEQGRGSNLYIKEGGDCKWMPTKTG